MNLTAWESKILDAIREYSSTGLSPTFAEIGETVGLRSSRILRLNLKSLEEKGFLCQRTKGRHRGIVLAAPLKTAA